MKLVETTIMLTFGEYWLNLKINSIILAKVSK